MKKRSLLYATLLATAFALNSVPTRSDVATLRQSLSESAPASSSVGDQLQEAFVAVAAKIKPSVVTIYAERLPAVLASSSDSDGRSDREPSLPNAPNMPTLPDDSEASLGSGMVIDDQGHILTNYHVVKDAVVIRVVGDTSGDSPARPVAKLIGYDEESDLAVLQASISPSFNPVQFGDSDALRIGEWVLAVGAPFDQAHTVTAGVISAKARHLAKHGQMSLQDYLQTDASINPGNSGGPLVDLRGKVIGVNTAILSPSRYSVGIGFAVPSATIKALLPKLLQGQQVQRGFLGIRYLPLSPGVAAAFGIEGGMQIGGLAQKGGDAYGPAFQAGLRKGDIITVVNGHPVSTSDHFRGFVATLTPGTVVQLEVLRPLQQGSQRRTFEITLGDRNEDSQSPSAVPVAPPTLNLPEFGLQVENIRELTAQQRILLGHPSVGLSEKASRVIITHIRPGGAADDGGLRQGEIIEKVNIMRPSVTGVESLGTWQRIDERTQLVQLLRELPAQTRVLVRVQDKQDVVAYKILTSTRSLRP